MDEKHNCLNCDADLTTPFCPSCGQKATTHRYSFKTILHDIPHAIFHVDSGFAHTFIALIKHPKNVCWNYVIGKRVGLTNPLLYMFVTMGLMVLFYHLFPVQPSPPENYLFWLDNLELFLIQFSKWSFTSAFILTSVFSAWMYRKIGFNFIEHTLINAFIAGEIAILTILMLPIAIIFSGTEFMLVLSLFHLIIFQVLYPAWVYYQTFAVKKGVLSFLYALFCSIAGTALFSTLAYMFYVMFYDGNTVH